MTARAVKYADAKAIKVKLTGELDARSRARALDPGGAARCLVRRRCEPGLFDRHACGAGRGTARAARHAARATAAARARGRSRGVRLADSDRGRRERSLARGAAACRGPLRCRQHQARQVRRAHRRSDDGRGSAAARAGSDGRHDDRHEPRDGARFHPRAAMRDRRSRRADVPRQGPISSGRSIATEIFLPATTVWGSPSAVAA